MLYYLKDRLLIYAAVLLIIVLISLHIGAITPYWKITPDSTTYVAAGESIASGKGYLEQGKPAFLFPPMTSMIFSVFSFIFPKNYLVLNTVVTIFALFSLLLFFFLFSKKIGCAKSFLITVLSLGSIFLFKQSTFLLSDIFYMFFSVSALVVIGDLLENKKSFLKYFVTGILVLAACMTRTVGITLVLAILLYVFISLFQKKIKAKPILFLSMLLPILFLYLWGVRNAGMSGPSYFKGIFLVEPYGLDSDYLTLFGFIKLIFFNLKRLDRIGAILINAASNNFLISAVYAKVVGLGLFCLGYFISLKKEVNIQNIYIALYLLSTSVVKAETGFRLLIPIIPFIFYYALEGTHYIVEKSRNFLGQFAQKIILAVGIIYILIYLGIGMRAMIKIIPGEHQSPMGSHSIKYEANYDIQKLAIWLHNNSNEEDTYICQHPNIWDIITEREGYFFPFSLDQSKLLDRIITNKIDYVLVDKNKFEVNKYLLPVIKEHSYMFDLIGEEEKASLYRVVLPEDKN